MCSCRNQVPGISVRVQRFRYRKSFELLKNGSRFLAHMQTFLDMQLPNLLKSISIEASSDLHVATRYRISANPGPECTSVPPADKPILSPSPHNQQESPAMNPGSVMQAVSPRSPLSSTCCCSDLRAGKAVAPFLFLLDNVKSVFVSWKADNC